MMKTLFVSFSCQRDNSVLEYFPKSIGNNRSGLGFILCNTPKQYFLSTFDLLPVEKHARNKTKDTHVPTVTAIRTGQGRLLVSALIRTVGNFGSNILLHTLQICLLPV